MLAVMASWRDESWRACAHGTAAAGGKAGGTATSRAESCCGARRRRAARQQLETVAHIQHVRQHVHAVASKPTIITSTNVASSAGGHWSNGRGSEEGERDGGGGRKLVA
jgi:hypothetical protein